MKNSINDRNYMASLESMSVEELKERIRRNELRLVYTNGVIIMFSAAAIMVCPIALAPIALITAYRDYYLIKNTNDVKEELEKKKILKR